jgi:glucokinase
LKNIFCGVDLGGTTVNIGMVTPEGKILVKGKIPSRIHNGVDNVLDEIVNVVKQWKRSELIGYNISSLGIGVAGLVDTNRGVLKEATNFPGWRDVPLVSKLESKLRLLVTMDNDANVAALGENSFGAGRGFAHMMMVTLGTGVGAGLILDGMIYRGAFGGAGEFGHITIKKDGRLCACGRAGCVEAYVGTKGIIGEAIASLSNGTNSALSKVEKNKLTPKEIFSQAQQGDEVAIKIYKKVGENLGYGLGSVVNLLNLQRIVVGGGVALAGDFLIDSAQQKLDEVSLNNSDEPVRILKASLGEHSGIVGAASLAMAAV